MLGNIFFDFFYGEVIGSLQGALRGAENLGHFGVGGLIVIAHGEYGALFRRELDNGFLKQVFDLGRRYEVGFRLSDNHEVCITVIVEIQQLLLLLDECQRFVGADARHPGLERRVATEIVKVAPNLDAYILCDIVGIFVTDNDTAGIVVDEPLILGEKQPER